MADKKITELDPVVSLSGAEIVPLVQSGVNKRTTIDDIVGLSANIVTSVNTFIGDVNLTQDNIGDGTTNKAYSATDKSKLAGIASGATANSSDSILLDRANHTGTQSADTITDGSTNKAYTAAEKTKLAAISGTNTGDQDLSGKQDVLVSGTNIKTINGSSVLGAGNIAISGAAWGGVTGTLSDQTDLQAALDLKANDSRVDTVSNFASPNAGGVVTGQYYDNSFQGTASSTLAGVANQMDLAPYYTSVDLPIDQIGIAVSTAVASAQAKVVIYDSDASGWPDNLLYESGVLDCATTGYKFDTLTFTFTRGTQYWVGVRKSSTATLRTINVSSAVNLGLTSSTAANYATILRRTVTFANAAPDPWVFTNTDRTANVTPPSVRFRAA